LLRNIEKEVNQAGSGFSTLVKAAMANYVLAMGGIILQNLTPFMPTNK
jgi:alpha-D-ribose 1-methylphosphonate 5-triphosphate synthase subunit PhnL